MPGFPQTLDYVLLDHKPGSVFKWLQSADVPELAFVVINPLDFRPDYPRDLVRKAANFVGIDASEDLQMLVICTVPPRPAEPTANFLAPVGIGVQSRRGAQIVLHESGFSSAETFLNK